MARREMSIFRFEDDKLPTEYPWNEALKFYGREFSNFLAVIIYSFSFVLSGGLALIAAKTIPGTMTAVVPATALLYIVVMVAIFSFSLAVVVIVALVGESEIARKLLDMMLGFWRTRRK